MFQNNPALRKKFLRVSTVSGLTGLLLTFGLRDAFILGDIFLTKYILIAITCISMVVLFFWILDILEKHTFPSKKIREKGAIAISTVLLFLAIQYFLIGIIGEQISDYNHQAAIEYCEQIGEITEEYKTLNGEYPTWQTMALLDEKPRKPILVEREYTEYDYYQKENDRNRYLIVRPSCSYDYRKKPPGATKTYFIPEKEWTQSWHR